MVIITTLIEIKTTKISELKQEYYQQLLGYYLLMVNSAHPEKVRRIGVYFSRHGYLWSVDVNAIATHEAFLRFLPRWNDLVEHYHLGRKPKEHVPSHSLEDLIAQVDALRSATAYMYWLSQLSDTDFSLWKAWPNASYYVMGGIEQEQERRMYEGGTGGAFHVLDISVD